VRWAVAAKAQVDWGGQRGWRRQRRGAIGWRNLPRMGGAWRWMMRRWWWERRCAAGAGGGYVPPYVSVV